MKSELNKTFMKKAMLRAARHEITVEDACDIIISHVEDNYEPKSGLPKFLSSIDLNPSINLKKVRPFMSIRLINNMNRGLEEFGLDWDSTIAELGKCDHKNLLRLRGFGLRTYNELISILKAAYEFKRYDAEEDVWVPKNSNK